MNRIWITTVCVRCCSLRFPPQFRGIYFARMDYQNFGMGTTCVAAFISQTYIAIANVGDSRAYYWAEDTLQQITVDHTRVQALLEQGEITEDEMATHPQRHMLVKAVGVERTVCPDFFRIDRVDSQPFILLLCSDGLSGLQRC